MTAAAEEGRARPGLLVSGAVALAVLLVLVGLGTWQLQRKAWKEGLIETLGRRLTAEPAPLPAAAFWPSLDRSEHEFRRVRFVVTLASGEEGLVYGAGSAFRTDVSGAGYWVFAPGRQADGTTVVLNRGFVPEGQQDPASHRAQDGPVEVSGAMRWPEARSWFIPDGRPAGNLWFVRDHRAIAAAKGWGEVAPFYVELETASGPDRLPRHGKLAPSLRNEHLQYALTWYGLALAFAIIFAIWLRGSRRQGTTCDG